VRLIGLEPTWQIIMVVFERLAAIAEIMETYLEKKRPEIDAD
jgi:hypothetical protein